MFLKGLLVSLAITALINAVPTLPSDAHEDILGGTLANINEFPFLVSIQNSEMHLCGGTLVNADTVVTAAHCVVEEKASDILVHVGSTKLTTRGVLMPVEKIIIRPNFNQRTLVGDIAIVKLYLPIPRGASVGYATLAPSNFEPRPGTVLTAAGWGSTSATKKTPRARLHKVDIPVISRDACHEYLPNKTPFITDSEFCAMAPGGGKDTCTGDSGGPIFDSHKTVVGIVSWGESCGSPKHPGIYTNIGSFDSFIKEHLEH